VTEQPNQVSFRTPTSRSLIGRAASAVALVVGGWLLVVLILRCHLALGLTTRDWSWVALAACFLFIVRRSCRLCSNPTARRVVFWSIALGMWCFIAYHIELFDHSFRSERWKDVRMVGNFGRRLRMVRAVTRMLEDAAIQCKRKAWECLGEPDSGGFASLRWRYNLGPGWDPWMLMDSLWLELRFDEAGNITSWRTPDSPR